MLLGCSVFPPSREPFPARRQCQVSADVLQLLRHFGDLSERLQPLVEKDFAEMSKRLGQKSKYETDAK
jgi:hypothetical protein